MAEPNKDQFVRDNAECIGIAYVSRLVDPVEVAADHPYMRDLAQYEFDDPIEVMQRFEHIAYEFDLGPDEIMRAYVISRLALREGEFNG